MSVMVKIYKACEAPALRIPLSETPEREIFPSIFDDVEGDDFPEGFIDLNQELVKNKTATFYARVTGGTTEGDLCEGDLLVVDRSMPLQNNKMVVCYLNGHFTVRKVRSEGGVLWLEVPDRSFDAIRLTEDNQFMLWGMVTYVVKRLW